MQEEKRSSSSYFITLTYETTHVPISKAGYMELKKSDIQKFIKRLRKAHERTGTKMANRTQPSIKYYCVGEYGGRTLRPHYHAIIFNCNIELMQPAWDMGQIHYGEVTNASVGYTLKYMTKKPRIPQHRNDDRTREFSLMSKGLGENYLTPACKRWHTKDLTNRMYCNLTDGKKISMPRYYKEKIYAKEQRQAINYNLAKRAKDYEDHLESTTTLHERVECDKQSFQKMYLQAERGRDRV